MDLTVPELSPAALRARSFPTGPYGSTSAKTMSSSWASRRRRLSEPSSISAGPEPTGPGLTAAHNDRGMVSIHQGFETHASLRNGGALEVVGRILSYHGTSATSRTTRGVRSWMHGPNPDVEGIGRSAQRRPARSGSDETPRRPSPAPRSRFMEAPAATPTSPRHDTAGAQTDVRDMTA